MKYLPDIFQNNRDWAKKITEQDPTFFERLSQIQSPKILWIGCSDSRVPANQVMGLLPGEVFVHRNVANLVVPSDLNCLSVIQFAVEFLNIEHIIVCGHYGCGGIRAVLNQEHSSLIDNWLGHIDDIIEKHHKFLLALQNSELHWKKLCELNVVEQVIHVSKTSILRQAWKTQKNVVVHGWIYGIKDGLLHDLEISVTGEDILENVYKNSVEKIYSVSKGILF